MPHLVMEYSDPVNERVNTELLLEELHRYLIETQEFASANIKSRAYACHQWLIGEENDRSNFIHLTLWLLDGRSPEVKQTLSQGLLNILAQHAEHLRSLTVDIRDMDKRWYAKA